MKQFRTHSKVHLKSPGCWINDPNGFIYFQGNYHLFYQYFPYGNYWGRMHWGHAVSKDLVHWEHLPVALYPSKPEDCDGCFSGSAVVHDNCLHLFYTGVRYTDPDPEDINQYQNAGFLASQMKITSKDGFHFDNRADKTVVIPTLEGEFPARETRDPRVWRGSDAWYMMLGSSLGKKGCFLFYRSYDLENWQYINCVEGPDAWGKVWECPDYFTVDGKQVLLFSPTNLPEMGNQNVCMQVFLQEDGCKLKLGDTFTLIDYGMDVYAAQSAEDAMGNRVMVAWLRMPGPVEDEWIGMFTIPRVVEVKENHICFRPHPLVKQAFTRRLQDLSGADDGGCYLTLDIMEGETISIGRYEISRQGNRICTDRSHVYGNYEGQCRFLSPECSGGLDPISLEIFVDKNLIEVFINEGEYVISNVVYDLTTDIIDPGKHGLVLWGTP